MALRKMRLPLGFWAALLMGLVLTSLYLMSSASRNASGLANIQSWLLLINTVGSALLLVLVLVNAVWLVSQLRRNAAGSRLTARMMFLFVLLALTPATVVFYFSMQFLQRSIDSWFDVEVDQAMDYALDLGRAALDQRMVGYLKRTEQMAVQLSESPPDDRTLGLALSDLRDGAGAVDLTLFRRDGSILATSSLDPRVLIPNLPDEGVLRQVRRGDSYVGLDEPGVDGVQIRAVVALPSLAAEPPRYLQAIYPVPLRISRLAASVQAAYARYKEMYYLRGSLKFSFALMLSLVLLLTLLTAVWVGFLSVRRMVAPVRDLAHATRAISRGDYSRRLPVDRRDELGFLVMSFNTMTERIARARDEVQAARFEAESQRAYLETILGSLSTGVLSLDAELCLKTANQAAGRILHVDLEEQVDCPLAQMARTAPHLGGFLEVVEGHLNRAVSAWHEELAILGPAGRQELFCRGTPLYGPDGERCGAVLVFDDVTALIQAQRTAAWAEVARRLAHEIKNPLTPIQLSAERLMLKLGPSLPAKDAEVLTRSTRTIVQQVEAMKKMVNAFSEYARLPKLQRETVNVPAFIEEVVALYPPQAGIEFELLVPPSLPPVELDPVLMRQVLHNLIKNAQEAFENGHGGRVTLALRPVHEADADWLELTVRDNGPGIPPDQVARIFDPYVTTKAKGTGLGLAIVRKIIEEHGGSIWLDQGQTQGAGFVIRVPMAHEGPAAGGAAAMGQARRIVT